MKFIPILLWLALCSTGFAQQPDDSLVAHRAKLALIVDSLKRVIQRDLVNSSAHLTLANGYYDSEYWNEAQSEYEIVLRYDPKNVDAHVDYADVLMRTAGTKEAIAEMKKVLHDDPEHLNGLFNIGILIVNENLDNRKKAVSEATPYFNRALHAAKKKHNTDMADKIKLVIAELEKITNEK